jgi:hypothetical protein
VLKNLLFLEALIVMGSIFFYMASTRASRRDIGYLPGVVMGSMAALAFLSPLLIILHIAVALVPLVLGRTKLKVGIIVAIGLFALPSLPTNLTLGGAWLFPWTVQSSLAIGGLLAFAIAPGRPAQAPPWADSVMFIVIAVLIVVDARGGAWIGFLRQAAMYAFVYVIPVYIITRSARNATEWRTLLTAMAGAGVILAFVVLFEAWASWPLYSPILPHFGFDVSVFVKWRGGLMRAYGPMQEATNMGCVLVICFAAALAARRSFVSNTAYIAIVSVIALGTLAPQSRGGMIGIAVAFIVSSFYRRGVSGMGQLGAAGFLLTGAYATAMMIGSIGSQISTSIEEAKGSGDYRTELLRRGLQEYWKSPIFGDSYANVVARMKDMIQGEGIVDFVNSYLYFALFAGGIGLVLFCLAFIIPIGRLTQIRRLLPPASAERELAGFCLALLTSAAVMLTFTSYLQRPSIFFLIAASVALMMKVPGRAVAAKKPIDLRVNPSDAPIVA